MRHNKQMPLFVMVAFISLSSTLFADGALSEYKTSYAKKNESGIEVRANVRASSGRFIQYFTETDPSGNTVRTDSSTSDLTSKGFSLIVGYGRDYVHRDQYSYFYLGYENQAWSDEYDSFYHAALVGIEGGIGSRSLKFIYGGEFALGALDTGVEGMGYLTAFSAEPFIGLRLISENGLSLNFRVGVRGSYIGEVESQSGVNSLLTENSAYTANAQVGLGYRFY